MEKLRNFVNFFESRKHVQDLISPFNGKSRQKITSYFVYDYCALKPSDKKRDMNR